MSSKPLGTLCLAFTVLLAACQGPASAVDPASTSATRIWQLASGRLVLDAQDGFVYRRNDQESYLALAADGALVSSAKGGHFAWTTPERAFSIAIKDLEGPAPDVQASPETALFVEMQAKGRERRAWAAKLLETPPAGEAAVPATVDLKSGRLIVAQDGAFTFLGGDGLTFVLAEPDGLVASRDRWGRAIVLDKDMTVGNANRIVFEDRRIGRAAARIQTSVGLQPDARWDEVFTGDPAASQ